MDWSGTGAWIQPKFTAESGVNLGTAGTQREEIETGSGSEQGGFR